MVDKYVSLVEKMYKKTQVKKYKLIFCLIILFILFLIIFSSSATQVTFSTKRVESIDSAALTNTSFVLAWCEDDEGTYFQIYNTTKATIVSKKTVTDINQGLTSCRYRSVATSAFDSNTFVVAYYTQTYSDHRFKIYNGSGINTTGAIMIDSDVGASAHGISTTALNSTAFVVGYYDSILDDIFFQVFDVEGNNIKSAVTVDSSVGISSAVAVSAFNSTHFVIGWFDNTDDDITFKIYNINGTNTTGDIDVDTSVSSSYNVDVKVINSTEFIIAFWDRLDTQARFYRYSVTGTVIGSVTNIDTTSTIAETISISMFNETDFVIAWHDSVLTGTDNNSFATYQTDGTGVLSQYNYQVGAKPHVEVFAGEYVTGIGFCGDTFLAVGEVSTTNATFDLYNSTGSLWDGVCAVGTPSDTCECPGIDTNWEIDLADHCNITSDCNLGTGKWNFTGVGYVSLNATLNATTIVFPPSGGTLYIRSNGVLNDI